MLGHWSDEHFHELDPPSTDELEAAAAYQYEDRRQKHYTKKLCESKMRILYGDLKYRPGRIVFDSERMAVCEDHGRALIDCSLGGIHFDLERTEHHSE